MGRRTFHGPRSWPWGLIGMLALALPVEWLVARQPLDFRSTHGWDWQRGGLEARRSAPQCEVLCFGDSMMQYGVVPRVLDDRLGGSSYNLALTASTSPASYFLL